VGLCGAATAIAQEAPPADDTRRRLEVLEAENAELKDDVAYLGERLDKVMPMLGKLTGYLDLGFFHVGGDGSGIRTDIGHRALPEYDGLLPDSWVFLGDPLSTAINSRGEPADTGESRAVVFDPIDNGGKASFLVNALSVAFFSGLSDRLTFNAIVDFVPRGRHVSEPGGTFLGDYVDVKLGYVEYLAPIERFELRLSGGKFDSVLGFEYRSQESPDRLGVTPSLICRYTCGHPIGVKARGRFWQDALIVNLALTNGSSFVESFPFYDEIDHNDAKTVSVRVSTKHAVGSGLEIGVSGAGGGQDLQTKNGVPQWHLGADVHLDWQDLDFTAELVRGKAQGKSEAGEAPCGLAPCLDYRGAYGQLGYRAANWLEPYVRIDWRDATHESGESFVYVSKLVRATVGVRVELGTHTVAKAEYVHNEELGRIPDFANDVVTSSWVVKF
jgi:hypothetical protein